MVIMEGNPGADGQSPSAEDMKGVLDPQGGVNHIVPSANKENIVAAGIDNGDTEAAPVRLGEREGCCCQLLFLKEQGHLPGESGGSGAAQVFIRLRVLPPGGVRKPATKACPRLSTSIRQTARRVMPVEFGANSAICREKA